MSEVNHTAGLKRFIDEGRHLEFINEQPPRRPAVTQPDRLVPASHYLPEVLEMARDPDHPGHRYTPTRLDDDEIPDRIRECADEVRRQGMPNTQEEVEYAMQIGPIDLTDEQWEAMGIVPHG